MATGTQTGIRLRDFFCRIPFASEGPYHGNEFGILQDLGLVDDLPVLESECLPNSCAMAAINLSQSGCCMVTLSGIASGNHLVGRWLMQMLRGWQTGGSQRQTGCQFGPRFCSDGLHMQTGPVGGPGNQLGYTQRAQ